MNTLTKMTNEELLNLLDFFYAYDLGLVKYLRKKGFRYISKQRHPVTNNEFAIFVITEDIQAEIDKWNEFHN